MRSRFNPRVLYAVVLLTCTLGTGGCYSWTTMKQAPRGSETLTRGPGDRRGPVACIGNTRIEGDAEAFLITLQDKLTIAAVFSDVRIASCGDKTAVMLNIVRAEDADQHIGRMVLTSATFIFYGVGTLIPYRYDYADNVTVEVVRPDGVVRHYRSQADASAYHTIWAGFGEPRRAVRGAVTDRVINDVVNQLARDRDVFAEN